MCVRGVYRCGSRSAKLAGRAVTRSVSYTTNDGLASNHINRIVQDSRGFLWFCTREGLSRFEGYQFTTFGIDQGLLAPNTIYRETSIGAFTPSTLIAGSA